MKNKKRGGKGQDVPTHQMKNEPSDTLKKLIRHAASRAIKLFGQQTSK